MGSQQKLKQSLFRKCQDYVSARILNAQKALDDAQIAANEETKSSVGDKHNTQRAIMQIERDKHAVQLGEAQKLQRTLNTINQDKVYNSVQLGSLVETDAGNYYIAISMGKVELEDNTFLVISPGSPLGQALLDRKKGDLVTFNGRKICIISIS